MFLGKNNVAMINNISDLNKYAIGKGLEYIVELPLAIRNDDIIEAVRQTMPPKLYEKNIAAVKAAYKEAV